MLMYKDGCSCAICRSKDNLNDVSGHELRMKTMDGSWIRPRYWLCEECYEGVKCSALQIH